MNINVSSRFLLSLLLCAATSPVLAQSGVIHFQGRIVAPVCNDAVSPEARAALAQGHLAAVNASAADSDRCGGTSASVMANPRVFSREQRLVEGAGGVVNARADGYTPDTVWTVTYQ